MKWLQFCFAIFSIGLPIASSQSYRLPETVIPSRYVVDIFVPEGVFRGQNDTFEGEVTMTFAVTSSTSEIKLHHRLNVTQVLVNFLGQELPVLSTSYNTMTEIYTITLQNALTIGMNYTLNIKYYGIFETDNMRGFYISTYKDENNQLSYLVLTKFEPVHTRHAFPCLDEPQYKATFSLSLTHPNGLNALANTPITSNTFLSGNYTKSAYQETTTMSTYLMAFTISSFTCTEGYSIENGVSHSVCSRPEEAPHRAWALEIGTSVLRTLESMTGLKYGSYMSKMHQIAIPDFSAGAMENWGLVSYRETGLLWCIGNSANSYKKSIALVVSHEFTHMWFGNLVTCKWWDYTFLNEGFARFYQYFAAAATKQLFDWELDKHFNVEVTQVALLADSTSDALALTSRSESPSEISGKFGTISYSKGAAIFRMIEKNIMGVDNFNDGIRAYLKAYEYQAAIPANLWSSLSEYVPSNNLPSGANLRSVLNNWVELSGHPVVFVAQSGNDVILTQERFLLAGNDTRKYYVPVTYTVSKDITTFWNSTVKSWLIPGETLTLSGVLNGSNWIVLNNKQSGFYRVEYDSNLWSAIKSQLRTNHLKIDVLNRAQLISDAYNFARAAANNGYGNWSYSDVLDLLSYLQNEEDYYPWYATIVGNNHLLQRLGYDTAIGRTFTDWMLNLMHKVQHTVPFDVLDNSNQVYTMKQVLILSRVCKYRHSACISESKKLLANYRDNGVKVPKNLRSIVYCYGLKYSDDVKTDFNFLWQKYTENKLMTEILTILSGLGCAEDVTSLKWLLGQTINATSGIRLQDFGSVWTYVYSSGKNGTNAAIEFISENYQQLTAAYSSVESLIGNAANYIYAEDQLEKLEILVNITAISPSHKATAQSALANAKSNILWAENISKNLKSFLETDSAAFSSKSSLILVLVFLLAQKLFL